jgi:hypothetical protein
MSKATTNFSVIEHHKSLHKNIVELGQDELFEIKTQIKCKTFNFVKTYLYRKMNEKPSANLIKKQHHTAHRNYFYLHAKRLDNTRADPTNQIQN